MAGRAGAVAGPAAFANRLLPLLLALALEAVSPAERQELLELVGRSQTHTGLLERVGRLFRKADVFAKAEKLVDKFRAKAEALADEVQPTELRELLYFLVDTVLDRQPAEEPALVGLPLVTLAPELVKQ